ncbi:MAG: hypothetical protein LBJ43_05675, partial [Propionibacteriaceae bacterium]|nr:hypothetical protein [Propionibacteriaceae bacterium]
AIFTNGESEHIKLVVNVDDSLTAAAGGSVANSASSRMLLLLPVTALGLLTLLTEHKRWLHRTK